MPTVKIGDYINSAIIGRCRVVAIEGAGCVIVESATGHYFRVAGMNTWNN